MFKERFVVDEEGNRVAVLLDMEDYRRLLEELEELESVRAYDAAKASDDEAIPFERAVAEIQRQGYSSQSGGMRMKTSRHQYVVDRDGRKVAVVVPMREYQRLLKDLHDLAVVAERRTEKPTQMEEVKRLLGRRPFRKRRVSG